MKNKKSSFNLSINAIVILILAIAILGLGLTFMGLFERAKETETEKAEVIKECEDKYDCEGMSWLKNCINNSCVKYECVSDVDCPTTTYDRCGGSDFDYNSCINHKCINIMPDCKVVATKDYGIKNPACWIWKEECHCYDYVILNPRKEIQHKNSIEVIEEECENRNFVVFRLKNLGEVN